MRFRRFPRFAVATAVCALPAGLVPGCGSSTPSESVGMTAATENPFAAIVQHPTRDACGPVPSGTLRCNAKIRMDVENTAAPQGFAPADLQKAYNLPSGGGSGQTVAIVDAQDDPDAESDLAVYRSQYGLPACTTANGCFKKVNQSGVQGSYPKADSGWAGEISLDLDMVSAICPSCNILLVEATSATTPDLGAGVLTAVRLGATAVSNSYGGDEGSTDPQTSAQYYNHPGVLITASAGDNGYGAQFPAASQYVLGVGGTSLVTSSTARGWSEQAWSGTGSGCSADISKPSFQSDTGCQNRTIADVSALADPNTGVSVYVSYGGNGGWNVIGGTSAASPIVASIFALLGKTSQANSFPYANTSAFYDVTTGSNGSCSPAYLCNAGPGYDGPTGWGTPNGQALATATNTVPTASSDAGGQASSGPSGPTGGAEDAGAGGNDAGPGGCPGYALPGTPSSCDACDSSSASCQANGCANGDYCHLSTNRCHKPPTSCGEDSSPDSGEPANEGASSSAAEDSEPDAGSQDGEPDAGSQDESPYGSQDGASASASQDESPYGSQDGSSAYGSQDGSSSSSAIFQDGAQSRRPSRPAAWRRLGSLVAAW